MNTTNPAILLVAYNVIPLLIGPPAWASITSIMYHVGEATQPCPFPVMGNAHGQVTEPKGNQFSGHNLGTIPYRQMFTKYFLLNEILIKYSGLLVSSCTSESLLEAGPGRILIHQAPSVQFLQHQEYSVILDHTHPRSPNAITGFHWRRYPWHQDIPS